MADYFALLDKLAKQYGIPPEELRAIYQLETGGGTNVRASPAGAQGHMQLMPGTARDMGVTDINDPVQNITGGVKYYAQQRQRFGDPVLAAAAYNAGPARVARLGAVPHIPETQKYVAGFRKLLGNPVTAAPTSATVLDTGAPQDLTAMDETDDQMGGLGMLGDLYGAQDAGETDLGALGGAPTAADFADYQRRAAAQQQSEAELRKQQFEEGQGLISKLYGAPSRSDTLWALSRALLSPKPYRGFGGTMANISEALSGMRTQQKTAEQQRAEALMRLRQTYAQGEMAGQKSGLANELELLKLRMQANKPKPDRWMAIPAGGSLQNVTQLEKLPVLTPSQVSALKANPANKGMQFMTTDGRPMEIE